MDNGSVILTWGGFFNDNHPPNVAEYDANNNVILEIDLPFDWISYRVHKQEVPFTLERPVITCDTQNRTLSAPPGHSAYEWSTGETTQSITPTSTGPYYVWVDQGIGFLRSRTVQVTDLSNLCLALDQPEPVTASISLHPNPTRDQVSVRVPVELQSQWSLEIYNLTGSLLQQSDHKGIIRTEVSLEEFPSGIYLFRVRQNEKSYSGRVLKY